MKRIFFLFSFAVVFLFFIPLQNVSSISFTCGYTCIDSTTCDSCSPYTPRAYCTSAGILELNSSKCTCRSMLSLVAPKIISGNCTVTASINSTCATNRKYNITNGSIEIVNGTAINGVASHSWNVSSGTYNYNLIINNFYFCEMQRGPTRNNFNGI